MKKLLWLDDVRNPTGYHSDGNTWASWFSPIRDPYEIIWVKNYNEFTDWITTNGLPNGICFDNSLGEDKTGYDCAKWLVDYCMDNDLTLLPLWNCQSNEPHSCNNIDTYLNNFKKNS